MIDMSEFNEYFRKQIEYKNDFGMVMRYNNARVDERIKSFVFVEGSTDKRFYINTNILKLSDGAEYFFSVMTDSYEEYKGKESVFYSFKTITNDETLKEDFNKCIFIVDRDYSLELKSHKLPMEKDEYDLFWVTKGHSFEDYFVDGTNINELFKYYHLTDDDIQRFNEAFNQFFTDTYEYFALCGAVAEVYDEITSKYRKKYGQEDVIILDFANNRIIDRDKLNEEKRNMRAYLRDNGKKSLFKEMTERVSKSPIYIRGHNVFEYIQKYLKHFHNIIFDDKDYYSDYKAIVKSLTVEL